MSLITSLSHFGSGHTNMTLASETRLNSFLDSGFGKSLSGYFMYLSFRLLKHTFILIGTLQSMLF